MARSTGDRPFYGSAVEILHTTLAGYRPKYHPSAHPYLISLDRFLVTCFAYVSSPCLRAKRRTSFVSIIDACITDNARLMLTTNVARSILMRPLKPDAFDVVHYFPLSMTPCFLPLVSCQTSSVSFLTYFFPSVRFLNSTGSYLVSRGWQCLAPAVPIELRAVSVIAQEIFTIIKGLITNFFFAYA